MFAVEWTASALDELAAFWIAAGSPERVSITGAMREIDAILRIGPQTAGESRGKSERVLLAPPLGVIFRVQPLDWNVRVLRVWHFRRKGIAE